MLYLQRGQHIISLSYKALPRGHKGELFWFFQQIEKKFREIPVFLEDKPAFALNKRMRIGPTFAIPGSPNFPQHEERNFQKLTTLGSHIIPRLWG